MAENTRFGGTIGQIGLEFVERNAIPRLLMKLGIRLHLTRLSLLDAVSIFEVYGVDRSRSTVYDWVHNANLQPQNGCGPDHGSVDGPVIRRNREQYWRYAAVDPDTDELRHTTLEPARTTITDAVFAEFREKHVVDDVRRSAERI